MKFKIVDIVFIIIICLNMPFNLNKYLCYSEKKEFSIDFVRLKSAKSEKN